MKKLFIHNPLFRIVSPLFSGCLVYLLILLINNNLAQVLEQFLGDELNFCILLSYLSHELARFSLLLFEKMKIPGSYWAKLILQISSSIILSIVLVSLAVNYYYSSFLGFSPDIRELIIFNSIFAGITGIYITLHISHQFLYNRNSQQLAAESVKAKEVEEEFRHFKKGLNPVLLFESFESLIVLLQEGAEPAEEYLDELATVYRYILSSGRKDLLPFQEEQKALGALVRLFEHLPFRNPQLIIAPNISSFVVPGTILQTLELIIRSSIASPKHAFQIYIRESENSLEIVYQKQEKLLASLTLKDLDELQHSYSHYSDEKITILLEGKNKIIRFPRLLPYSLDSQQVHAESSF